MRLIFAFLLLLGLGVSAADRTVVVSTNGVLLSPTNLWSANSNALKAVVGTGAGDVVGPGSSTAGGLALFSGATGKLLSSSALTEASLLTEVEAASLYAPLASPALTGNPTAPTAAPGDSDTSIATTAFVASSFAPIDSPVFTGTVTFDGASFGTVVVVTNLFVGDSAYGSDWDGSTNVPTRNAVYDKIQSFLSVPTLTKTANYSPSATDSGAWINNDGASGAVTNTLPAALAGRHYGFVILAPQQVVVKAAGADTIRIAGTVSAGGGQAATNVVGTTLHLHCPVAGKWIADSQIGAWAVQ